jgi:hypothetical protein
MSESAVMQAKFRILRRLRGRCQYVPNSFVPVPPEHGGATMSPY